MTVSSRGKAGIARRQFLRAAVGLVAGAPLLAACSTGAPLTAAPARPAAMVTSLGVALPDDAAPPEQQILRFAGVEGKHLNRSGNTYDSFATEYVMEPLLWLDPQSSPLPGAAESWQASADGLSWTFHLRKNAKWSDGTPVTAQDWVYSFRRALDPALANPYAWFYYAIKNAEGINTGKIGDLTLLGVEAIDTNTLVFTTEVVIPYFHLVVSHHPVITPTHMIKQHGDAWAYSTETAVSNGPFRFKEWNKGKNISFVPNPYYNGLYKPKLEQAVMTFVPQTNAPLLQMYKANEIDEIDELSNTADVSTALNDADLKKDLETYAAFVTFYMFFNTDKPPFNNLKLRQAFSHAIDRTALTEQVMQKLALPAYSMLPNGFPCSQNSDPAIQSIQAYDAGLARKLMADAGHANGQGLPTIELWTRQGQYAREAEAIQRMLKTALGVTVQPRDFERALFMDKLAKHEITLGIVQWKMDAEDPTNFLDWWGTQSRHTWKNEQFNKLLERARVELDCAKRCQYYSNAERMLIEDVGAVFLGSPVWGVLARPWVKGGRARRDGAHVRYWLKLAEIYIQKH